MPKACRLDDESSTFSLRSAGYHIVDSHTASPSPLTPRIDGQRQRPTTSDLALRWVSEQHLLTT